MDTIEQQLPAIAFLDNAFGVRVPSCDAPMIAVKRGNLGYWPIYRPRRDADELNAAQGVSPAMAEAMFAGSTYGWDVPAANPAHHSAFAQSTR